MGKKYFMANSLELGASQQIQFLLPVRIFLGPPGALFLRNYQVMPGPKTLTLTSH